MINETIYVDRDERFGIITMNGRGLNALNSHVMNEVTTAAAESTPIRYLPSHDDERSYLRPQQQWRRSGADV